MAAFCQKQNDYNIESRFGFSIFAWMQAVMPLQEEPDVLGGGHAAQAGQIR